MAAYKKRARQERALLRLVNSVSDAKPEPTPDSQKRVKREIKSLRSKLGN